MGLLSVSNILISATLLVNAGAILNFRLRPSPEPYPPPEAFAGVELPTGTTGGNQKSLGKLIHVLQQLRFLRVFIAFWNVVLIIMMLLFFS
eukprot:TRINITY_DN15905_c0_g1_i1.p1 TRINITY_DN15905_c0_g1~~TRINITY_DN15905_c0_g1_i1.p1  ORF type:complete len:105 (-),score=7.00 TRINITY_DN15905_c0_g1_i1:162-434(-)